MFWLFYVCYHSFEGAWIRSCTRELILWKQKVIISSMNIGGAFCGGRHFIKRSIVLVEWIFMEPIGSNLLKKQVRSDVEWLKCCRNDVVTRNSLSFQILMPADEAFCMRRLTRYYNFPGLKTDWGNFWESETHWLSLIYAPSSSWIPERELCRLLRLPKLQNYVKIWSMSESFKIAMEQSILKSLQRTLWGKFDWGYRLIRIFMFI